MTEYKKENEATIKDVAKLAGVSISTVSRVLNNLDRVSEETRARVWQAVHDLSFTRNSLAASMITGEIKNVLIVLPDLINEFYGTLILGAQDVFSDAGYLTLVTTTGDEPDVKPVDYLLRFAPLIDGALVISANEHLEELTAFKKPIVIVDRSIPDCPFDSVTFDNFDCCYRLTRLLLEHNHKKIGLIVSDSTMNIGEDRIAGYCAALTEAGIKETKRYIRRGSMLARTGYHYTKEFLALEDPPTAIVAGSSLIGNGSLHALSEANLLIGRDISLVSVDEQDYASFYGPGITTAFTPRVEMGQFAAQRLLNILRSKQKLPVHHEVLPVELVIRGSVATLGL